jgi:8-oxo-dGTP pyrophosphatase MutT (NUDIX family)
MKESVGCIITNKNHILACIPFGRKGLDIPKGMIEANESYPQTMVREVWEETNITLNYLCYWEDFEFCGTFKYTKEKDLTLYHLEDDIDISKCRCNSYFDYNGKQVAEVVGYV